MIKILPILLLFIVSTADAGDFDCKILIGKWTGIASSDEWGFNSRYISEYLEDGRYFGYFEMRGHDGVESNDTIEERTWYCDGNIFGTKNVARNDGLKPEEAIEPHKIYKIIELNSSYRKYQTIQGNEPGKVYEAVKVQEP